MLHHEIVQRKNLQVAFDGADKIAVDESPSGRTHFKFAEKSGKRRTFVVDVEVVGGKFIITSNDSLEVASRSDDGDTTILTLRPI